MPPRAVTGFNHTCLGHVLNLLFCYSSLGERQLTGTKSNGAGVSGVDFMLPQTCAGTILIPSGENTGRVGLVFGCAEVHPAFHSCANTAPVGLVSSRWRVACPDSVAAGCDVGWRSRALGLRAERSGEHTGHEAMFVFALVFDGASVQEHSLCAPLLEARLALVMSQILLWGAG